MARCYDCGGSVEPYETNPCSDCHVKWADKQATEALAELIRRNCERLFQHQLSSWAWDRRQRRLWDMASRRGVSVLVMKQVAPIVMHGIQK